MTAQPSAYVRFRRALDRGDLGAVKMAALDLPRVGLRDALDVCLLLRKRPSDQFQRSAVRWLGRFALEGRGVDLEALRAATAAFDQMAGAPDDAMEALAGLCVAHRVAH